MTKQNFSQGGFSLIELMVVVAILAIVVTYAVLQYGGVRKGVDESLVKSKLAIVADAQHKFRTSLGKRRYGSLCFELKKIKTPSGALLPDSVAQFNDKCQSTPNASGWLIYDQIETEPFNIEPLKSSFSVYAKKADTKHAKFCMFEDLVLRSAPDGEDCSRDSVAVE